MASASGIRAGAAYVELSVKDNALIQGMQRASKLIKDFGSGLTSLGSGAAMVGVAITAPFIAATKTFAEYGSQLADMSKRTGFSVETLSSLGYAAKMSGASLEEVGTGIKFMQKNLIDAIQGGNETNAAFARLGISVSELMSMSPEDQFQAIGNALNNVKDPAERTQLALAILGRSGTQLLPLASDMKSLAAEAQKLGIVMSTQDAVAADALGDAIDRVMMQVKMLAINIGSTLMPILMEWSEWLSQSITDVSAWIKENETMVKVIAGIGAALVVAGAALVGFGMAINAMGGSIGVISAITKGIWGMVAAVGALNLASLPSMLTSFATGLSVAANALRAFSAASMVATGSSIVTTIGGWIGSFGALTSAIGMATSSMVAFTIAALPIIGTVAAIAAAVALLAYDLKLIGDIRDAKRTLQETTEQIKQMDQALRNMDQARGGGKDMTFTRATDDINQYVESLIKAGKTKEEVTALLNTRRASEVARAEDTKDPWTKQKAFSKEYYEGMQNESKQMVDALDSILQKGLDSYDRMFTQVAEEQKRLTEIEKAEQDKRNKADMIAQAKRTGAMKKALEDRQKAVQDFQNWLGEQEQKKTEQKDAAAAKELEKSDPLAAVDMASKAYQTSLKDANDKVAYAQKLLNDALSNPEADVRRNEKGEVEVINNEEVNKAIASAKSAYQIAEDQRQLMEDATRAAIEGQTKANEASKAFEERYSDIGKQRQQEAENVGFSQKMQSAKGSPQDMKTLEVETDSRLSQAVKQAAEMRMEVRALFAQAEASGSEKDLERAKAGAEKVIDKEREVDVLRERLLQIGENMDAQIVQGQKMDVTGSFSAAAAAGLGVGSSAADRTAKATEETAKNTKRMLDKLDTSVATFS